MPSVCSTSSVNCKVEEEATIVVQVQPNASRNRVARFEDGVWHLKIAAPPVKGKANQELLKYLSDILGVSKADLTITKGTTSKRKLIAFQRTTLNQVRQRLEKLL